ncbi:MAG: phosphoglucosamine mutase [Actinomycetota bacterium]|nr:phosphoglucosamine mutase [Actinomycetota bacterium]
MGALFGTDGVRGRWGTDLTPDLVRSLAYAATRVLGAERVLIGRDTRASGEPIERELAAGIAAAGGHPLVAGIIPTPAIAVLVRSYRCEAGAVISASHNPADDNGIKFFGPDGMKLPDDVEHKIESEMDGPAASPADTREPVPDAEERYLDFLLDHAPSVAGLRVIVDAANGAAFHVAPEALRRAGATVEAIGVSPDGRNINDNCGSTHPEHLQRLVVERGAHVGIAHDGDADRLIAVDEGGEIVDGDQVLAICALDRKRRGVLKGNAVVATVMANLGFHRAMRAHGVDVVETAVGDRYVLEAMRERGLELGGEQSGHLIFLDRHTTGDGIMTALRLLDVLVRADIPLSELAAVAPRLPQVLINVNVGNRDALDDAALVWDEVENTRAALGEHGRVLIRPSGTEPVVRVMVQADTEDAAQSEAERLSHIVESALS